jgi:hypothetical protein
MGDEVDREAHFKLVEQKLEALLSIVRPSLTDRQADNVRSFINATEYGLAFEEITGWAVEENRPFSADALRLAEEAAAAMGMQNDEYLDILRQRERRSPNA